MCQKWKVKLVFSRRLKQFDGLTWLTPTPLFYDRFTPLSRERSCTQGWGKPRSFNQKIVLLGFRFVRMVLIRYNGIGRNRWELSYQNILSIQIIRYILVQTMSRHGTLTTDAPATATATDSMSDSDPQCPCPCFYTFIGFVELLWPYVTGQWPT